MPASSSSTPAASHRSGNECPGTLTGTALKNSEPNVNSEPQPNSMEIPSAMGYSPTKQPYSLGAKSTSDPEEFEQSSYKSPVKLRRMMRESSGLETKIELQRMAEKQEKKPKPTPEWESASKKTGSKSTHPSSASKSAESSDKEAQPQP
ncbi:hypothetical protein H7849_16790 [Alloacidobacterium dinghuense]|uniref:Uncharacterized protein n=1 Tax=Alloacidobacterium dinghuense TaxID=2763107 RepID=A0A7G8BDZ9_9BACT|nr:hypothetical protein [Alloacidobacterium dinghuense]QNI30769.1 hypothetical protein H7849_16790 [Alloacidobacterium dinghuense]